MGNIMKNKGTGAGGAKTNATGIKFEENTYLGEWITMAGYRLEEFKMSTSRTQSYKIYEGDTFVGYYGRQSRVYDALKDAFPEQMTNEHIKEVLSKKINPDAFILNMRSKELIIFEKKWQQTSGSVDEKVQTGPFKLEMFQKLLRNIDIESRYQYILSEWFIQDQYRNIREYYEDNKEISVWIENFNLGDLDMKNFLK